MVEFFFQPEREISYLMLIENKLQACKTGYPVMIFPKSAVKVELKTPRILEHTRKLVYIGKLRPPFSFNS